MLEWAKDRINGVPEEKCCDSPPPDLTFRGYVFAENFDESRIAILDSSNFTDYLATTKNLLVNFCVLIIACLHFFTSEKPDTIACKNANYALSLLSESDAHSSGLLHLAKLNAFENQGRVELR